MLKQAPEQQICLGLDITTGFIIVAYRQIGRIVEDPCKLHEDSLYQWRFIHVWVRPGVIDGAISISAVQVLLS
ncbi:hypothetical protein D5086_017735 [Populus alba]|uniref:Uncharacterized protein n=1 Tax=Populus alba TaxID=43335 RepID=A0ACC4BMY6_POPAL